jgi:RNA polymerase sigma-70 factor (ECF subfamily)
MNDPSAEPLADRLAARDPEAFRELVETYKKKFFGLAYEFTRNPADAEDVSQMAFIKVFRSIDTFKKGSSLNSWLYRIVANTAIDHIRKRPFFPAGFPESAIAAPGTNGEDPAASAERRQLRGRIERALGAVSERERMAFILHHDHGFSLKEIAEIQGVSLGSVKSYIFRSIRKLQKELSAVETGWAKETDHA